MGVAIITGASSGIGAEFAKQLDGRADVSHLWLIARRREEMVTLSQNITKPTTIITADLSTREGCDSINQLLCEEKPRITYLVNSAGFGKHGDFAEIDREEQLTMIDVNCRAIIDITHSSLPFMKEGSSIINISSIAGASPLGAFAIYGATKAFLNNFSIALRAELRDRQINVLTVTPGSVETNFHKSSSGGGNRKKKLFAKKNTVSNVVAKALLDLDCNKIYSIDSRGSLIAKVLGKLVPRYTAARIAYTKIYPKEK